MNKFGLNCILLVIMESPIIYLKVMCPAIASNSAGGNKKHVIFHVITFNVEMRQPLLLSASACSLLCEASISCDQFCIAMELTNHNPIF